MRVIKVIRAMTREELAERAGVTTKTLGNYAKRHRDELYALGMRPRDILSPKVVAWFAENYGVNVDD